MFGANRGGQGQQYSSPNVTCNERYWNYNVDKHSTIASPCTISSIVPSCNSATFAESALSQHHAVFATSCSLCMQSDFMQSQ